MHTKNTASKKNKKLVLNKTTVSSFMGITMGNTQTRTTTGMTKSSDFITCLV
jgi:hypothetical protein